jgi:di/tricarboxylate transporter
MSPMAPMTAVAVGFVCAAAGVYASPAEPRRHEMDWALLRTGIVMVAACAWALWRDEVGATLLSFVVATYVLGEVRLRRLHRKA